MQMVLKHETSALLAGNVTAGIIPVYDESGRTNLQKGCFPYSISDRHLQPTVHLGGLAPSEQKRRRY